MYILALLQHTTQYKISLSFKNKLMHFGGKPFRCGTTKISLGTELV
jgi:hypothetical protein